MQAREKSFRKHPCTCTMDDPAEHQRAAGREKRERRRRRKGRERERAEAGGEREEGGAEGDGTASEVEAIEYEIHAEDGQVDEGNLFGNIHDITRLRRKDT